MDLTRWRQIIKNSGNRGLLFGTTDLYIRGVLKQVPRFAKIAAKPETRFMVADSNVRGRKIRMIHALTQGKLIPISISAIEGKKQTNKQKVYACMRELIGEQIADYRVRRKATLHVDFVCPLSGVDLRKSKALHVDHYSIAFSKLVADWCKLEKVNLNQIKIQGRAGKLCFVEPRLNQSWRRYHATHADLQLVDSTANLQKGKKSLVEYKMR